jgi:PAS domain S-box-containing protein
MDRIIRLKDLKLSEETLNTLIDNTDIGIIIADTKGNVFYSNEKFNSMFGQLDETTHMSVVSQLVSKSDRDNALAIFREREYKGKSGGTIKALHKDGYEFYTKIYSSRIDYEGSKAYLTTVVDVTEYMVEDIEPIENI